MNKFILGTLLVFFLVVNAQSAIAVCKTYFTGGGNITEGHGKDSLKITFATNVLYDYGGLPAGVIHFNFVNTSSGFLDGGTFFSKEINEFYIDPRELTGIDDSEYFFVRITATGQFDGEDGWTITARFADFKDPNKKQKGAFGALSDAVRLQVFDPEGDHVYDTAWLEDPPRPNEFNRDQVWRTFLDGGIVNVHCFE